MITYILHQKPVSGHNHCKGIVMEIEPLSPTSGRVVGTKCCGCRLGEWLEKVGSGTIVSLPPGQNWKRASGFSMGEDATIVKPLEMEVAPPETEESE